MDAFEGRDWERYIGAFQKLDKVFAAFFQPVRVELNV
ncbi:MAG: hypothetical protein ACJAU6_003976 [Alphaproteobacteria bacterium]|jgi:hypothetical protein